MQGPYWTLGDEGPPHLKFYINTTKQNTLFWKKLKIFLQNHILPDQRGRKNRLKVIIDFIRLFSKKGILFIANDYG